MTNLLQIIAAQINYDPTTGNMTWLVEKNSHGGKVHPGDSAGHVVPGGYVLVGVNGRIYRAHRLAWLLMTGEMPPSQIDHIDGNKANNAWSNLRLLGNAENCQNLHKAHRDNRSGLLGVSLHKETGKYVASIKPPKRRKVYLGLFATPEEAHACYLQAKSKIHRHWVPKS